MALFTAWSKTWIFAWVLRLAGEKIAFHPDVLGVRRAMLGRAALPPRTSAADGSLASRRIRKKYFLPVLQSSRLNFVDRSKITSPCVISPFPQCSTFALPLSSRGHDRRAVPFLSRSRQHLSWMRPVLALASLCSLMGVSVGLYGMTPVIIFRSTLAVSPGPTTGLPVLFDLEAPGPPLRGRPGSLGPHAACHPASRNESPSSAWDSHHGVPHD